MLTQNIYRIINNEWNENVHDKKTFGSCFSPSVWKYSSSSTSVRSSASNKVKGSPFCSSPGNLPLAENFNSGWFFGKKIVLSIEKVNQGRASGMVKGSPFCSSPGNLPRAGNFTWGCFSWTVPNKFEAQKKLKRKGRYGYHSCNK